MTTAKQKRTLTRVREAQDALDRAKAAMGKVQSGLSAVESVADKAESARSHPVRTTAIFILLISVAVGALIGLKGVAEDRGAARLSSGQWLI